jgi:hypothetical protein
MKPTPESDALPLDWRQCLALLAIHSVGRWVFVRDGQPMAVPVNYRLTDDGDGSATIVVRTRPGSVIDCPGERVAFEIDSYDPSNQRGWSVLVTGEADDISGAYEEGDSADPGPYLPDRFRWLRLRPTEMTGRTVLGRPDTWAFALEGYL